MSEVCVAAPSMLQRWNNNSRQTQRRRGAVSPHEEGVGQVDLGGRAGGAGVCDLSLDWSLAGAQCLQAQHWQCLVDLTVRQ